ncbi:hypothetical protein MFIFM68171_10987 [Madurella fahalii]|uniref:Uncharacterized protein n=1 Tax=Madurella fahalii TaxID=1157608 RepID=A0ABQ0GST0_9PEZI
MRDPNPLIDEKLMQMPKTRNAQIKQDGVAATTSPSPLSLTEAIRYALQPTRTPPSVFLQDTALETSAVPFSRARTACKQSSSKTQWFILDRLLCRPGTDVQALKDSVRNLARKLRRADPFAFGLLNCKGFMRVFE